MAMDKWTIGMGVSKTKRLAIVFLGIILVFFWYKHVTPYFTWTQEAYGSYFWARRFSLVFHITGGSLALLAGIYQLWTGFTNRTAGLHRRIGWVYLTGVAVGSIGGILLSLVLDGDGGPVFAVGLFCLALAWITTTATAYYCIKKRNVLRHQQWMIRSYIVTFAFVTFRMITDYAPYDSWWHLSEAEISNISIWIVWVMPLLAYEVLVQWREITPGK